MFSLLCGLWTWLLQKEERRMVLLGVDNAGKTTTLEQLKAHFGLKAMPNERIPPTIGFNIGRIQIDKVIAVFWDLGGHASFRSVWHNYYPEVQGVMFVVDSADAARLEEAKKTLLEVVSHEQLQKVPLLCLANKQDKPEALSVQELSRIFEFERVFSDRPFHVHPCCALQGQGLEAAVRWLLAEADKFAKK
ncbi:unnamed protein product [Effrenium voratum]|nr:unnamed protein product [Effrenium voratum]CAJ1424503.1 unnamed protein product [Effrenium voratum]